MTVSFIHIFSLLHHLMAEYCRAGYTVTLTVPSHLAQVNSVTLHDKDEVLEEPVAKSDEGRT